MVLRPAIYVMGPFRAPSEWERAGNIHIAKHRGVEVAHIGGAPIIPHTTIAYYWDTLPEADQMQICFSILARCHAALTVHGWSGSEGTRAEIDFCNERHMPVFHKLVDLAEWIRTWNPANSTF